MALSWQDHALHALAICKNNNTTVSLSSATYRRSEQPFLPAIDPFRCVRKRPPEGPVFSKRTKPAAARES
jgi:hypothetical protein